MSRLLVLTRNNSTELHYMTNQKTELALEFLKSQPAVSASILEQQPSEDVAAFLKAIPRTFVTPVLEKMLPQYTAQLLDVLDDNVCADFLSPMKLSLITSILRLLNNAKRQNILNCLPNNIKLSSTLLLRYSKDMAGAWMLPNVITMPDDCSVETALQRISTTNENADTNIIYIVNRDLNVLGQTSISMVLRSKKETSITDIIKNKTMTVPARTTLTSIEHHNAWEVDEAVAVINRNEQLVGMLRHLDLRKGLKQQQTRVPIGRPQDTNTILNINEVYGNSLLALLQVVSNLANPKG